MDKILNLLLKVEAILDVMVVILVEMIVLRLISSTEGQSQWARIPNHSFFSDLQEDFNPRHMKGSEVDPSSRRSHPIPRIAPRVSRYKSKGGCFVSSTSRNLSSSPQPSHQR